MREPQSPLAGEEAFFHELAFAAMRMEDQELPSEQDTAAFCGTCDHRNDPYPKHCKDVATGAAAMEGLPGVVSQTRYVIRGWCNCADVDGVRGTMERTGFTPHASPDAGA